LKFTKITKKSYKQYDGKVYDLTVKDSHSYNINGLICHNSGGGSLVAYAAGITEVNPLQYGLIFERFLNPQRGKLPDIDSDFCVDKGWMVFDYLIRKYGKERSCNIITFGRLQLKAVIKDISKALGIPFEEVNEVTRSIPDDIKHITELIEAPEFRNFFNKYPDIYLHASKLEGSPRHASQHPAGIAITPIPVMDLLPVQNAKETQEGLAPGYLAQFEKEQCEMAGLVKLDILKLKNVTEIRNQLKMINKLYGKNYTEQSIPYDDPKTWEVFAKGDTLGTFQFASNVAIPVIKKIKCSNIEELAAANSFIRPGTSGLDEYVATKDDPSKLRKLDPRLDRHLATTYGAIVFQEQIMFLISELMGITFGEADLYRRALEKPAKDKKGYVKNFNENVVEIASAKGFDPKIVDIVRQLIIDNSGYAFNKSHAVAYSMISYWTAWIKVNYPLVFYTQMFNGSLEQLPDFMEEAKKHGITIKPPHVSYSKYESIIEDEPNKIIRIGLNAVKGIGPAAMESIIAVQPFASVDEFFEKNNLRSVNKRVVEAAIKANAFEGLPINIENDDIPEDMKSLFNISTTESGKSQILLTRNQMWLWYEKVNEANAVKTIPNYAIPTSMIKGKFMDIYELATETDNTIIIPEDMLEKFDLQLDKVLDFKTRKRPKGFLKLTHEDNKKVTIYRKPFVQFNYELSQVKENYLQSYLKEIEEFGYSFLSHPLEPNVSKIQIFSDVEDGYMMVTAGIITDIIQRTTKTNKKYYWVMIRTPRDVVRITCWDNQYKQYKDIFVKHNLIVAKGVKGYGGINIESVKRIVTSS
jgi:DNA-directed DNA polymerase III PolC